MDGVLELVEHNQFQSTAGIRFYSNAIRLASHSCNPKSARLPPTSYHRSDTVSPPCLDQDRPLWTPCLAPPFPLILCLSYRWVVKHFVHGRAQFNAYFWSSTLDYIHHDGAINWCNLVTMEQRIRNNVMHNLLHYILGVRLLVAIRASMVPKNPQPFRYASNLRSAST
jgi:hypothetical protein